MRTTFPFLRLRHPGRLLRGPSCCRASCGLGHWPRGARRLAPASALASDGRRLAFRESRELSQRTQHSSHERLSQRLEGNSREHLSRLRALSLLESLTLPNKRLLQAARVHRIGFDAGSSPALFPHGGSGPIVSSLAFDAAAEAQGVDITRPCQVFICEFS